MTMKDMIALAWPATSGCTVGGANPYIVVGSHTVGDTTSYTVVGSYTVGDTISCTAVGGDTISCTAVGGDTISCAVIGGCTGFSHLRWRASSHAVPGWTLPWFATGLEF